MENSTLRRPAPPAGFEYEGAAAAPAAASATAAPAPAAAPSVLKRPAPPPGFSYDAPAAAPALVKPETGDFMRGFKTSAHQLPQLAGGALAFGGDVLSRTGKALGTDGATGDAVADYGLDVYKKHEADTQALSKPSDSFTHVLKNPRELGSFLKYTTGYVGGQAAESLAAMGVGALAGSELPGAGNVAGAVTGLVARPWLERQVLKKTAELIAEKGMAKEAAEQAAGAAVKKQLGRAAGATAASLGMNETQELGSIYGEARDQANEEGRTLTGGDLARVGGASVAAAGVDTLADMLNVGSVAKGVKAPVADVGKSVLRQRLAAGGKEALKDATREGATEAAQTMIERYGAGQSLNDAEALQDVVDSTAAGVVGGAGAGSVAALHTQKAPAANAEPAAAAPVEAQAAQPVQAADVPNPGAAPGSMSDVANVLAKPAGPMERTAQAAAEQGVVAPTAAAPAPAAPVVDQPPVAAPMAATPAPEAASPAAPIAVALPWVNTETGEVGKPTKGQLTSAVADYVTQLFATQGHMRFNNGDLADQWGVPKADIARVRNRATAMAADQVRATEGLAATPAAAAAAAVDTTRPVSPREAVASAETRQTTADSTDSAPPSAPQDPDGIPSGAAVSAPLLDPERAAEEDSIAGPSGDHATGAPTDERVPSPTPAAANDADTATAGTADAQPAAIVDNGTADDAAEPAPAVRADLPGGSATADAKPALTPAPPAEEPVSARPAARAPKAAAAPTGNGSSAAPTITPPADPVSGALRSIADGQHPEKALGAADDATVRAVAKAMGRTFSPKASTTAIVERLGEQARGDWLAQAKAAVQKLAPADVMPSASAAVDSTIETANQQRAAEPYLQRRVRAGNSFREVPFKSAHAVQVAIKRIGANPSHYTIEQAPGGFVGRRKSEVDLELEKVAPRLAAMAPGEAATKPPISSVAARDAETMRVKTADGEVNGRSHVDSLLASGFTKVESTRAGDKMVHSLVAADGRREPIKARQLKYAKEATARHAETTRQQIEAAAHEAATSPQNERSEPTQAQKEAGNYKLGHVTVHGMDISIENPRGSTRSGVGENGKPWSHVMSDHYGYVRGTVGADGDHVDVYVGPKHDAPRVFVVDQIDQKTGKFDEHKVMLGFADQGAAVRAYRSNFDPGWKVGPVADMTAEQFKTWLKEGDTTKPVATQAAEEPASAARDSYEQTLARRLRKLADDVEAQGTNNGRRPLDERWAAGAIKRLADADGFLHGMLREKLAGAAATAKIAFVKARTPADLRAIAGKLEQATGKSVAAEPATTEESSVVAPAPASTVKDSLKVATKPAAKRGGIATNGAKVRVVGGKLEYVPGAKETLEAYFKPGDVIKSYAGHDKVLGFTWNDGNWSVRVQEVNADGSAQVVTDHRNNVGEIRNHGTMPDKRELLAKLGKPVLATVGNTASTNRKAEGKAASVADESASQSAAAVLSKTETTADSGEELWANRRNSTGKGIGWDDIADLNDTLKAREAVKTKVWPRPNYGELVDGGMPAPIAHVIKQVYDAIATKPQMRVPTDQHYQDYIAAVQKVRDAAFAWAQQVMEKTASTDAAASAGVSAIASRNEIDPAHAAAMVSALRIASGRNYPILEAVFPMPASEGGSVPSRFRTGEQGKANNALANLLGGNKIVSAMQVGESSLRDATKAIEKGWPAAQEAWEKTYTIHESKAGEKVHRNGESVTLDAPEFWVSRKVATRFRSIVAEGFKTREEAVDAAKAAYAQRRQTGGDGAKAEAPVALQNARTGPERRAANEDVTSDHLRETFGFKGINFGNWMKGTGAKNAAERQAHLNHAYDAFHDLAEIMGLPAKAMSLNGTLGLAIGAQGNGGKKAFAAHFVPGVNEINLTREQGAGSLAHEWAHALDHYFAAQAGGRVVASKTPFLTEHLANSGDGVRAEVRRAFKTIVEAMETRPETEQEQAARLSAYQKRGRDGVESVLRTARESIEKNGKGDKTPALEQFDAMAQRLRVGDVGEGYVKTGKGRMDAAPQVVGQVANLVKETTGRKPDWTDALSSYARMVSSAVAAKSDNAARAARVTSDFAKEARKLEGSRTTPYWSTKLEMFARAFQSYVLDKLAAEGNRNSYLTRSQMDPATLKVAQEMGVGEAGDRYPRGAERAAIDKAFDALAGDLKTREDESGNVALFRQTGESAGAVSSTTVTPAQEAHTTRIRSIATAAMGKWKGDDVPRLEVVATPEQLPPAAKRDANGEPDATYKKAAGMYDGRTIYIVASAHSTNQAGMRKILKTMAHEGVGHYGVERIVSRVLGADAWAKIETATERLRNNPELASPAIREVLASLKSRYPGVDKQTFAREFLAVTAERGVKNGLLDRAIAAIRQWLRTVMPDLRLSEHELRQLLVASDEYLRVGESQQQRVQSRAALAFSSDDALPQRDASTFAEARRQAQAFQSKPLANAETGLTARVSRNSLDKMLSSKAVGKSVSPAVQSLAVANLDSLFERATLGWSKPDKGGDTNIVAIHRFFAPLRVGDRMVLAKLTVKEMTDPNHRNPLYSVEAVDLNEERPAAQWVDAAADADGIDPTSIRSAGRVVTIAQGVQDFNSPTGSRFSQDSQTGTPAFKQWFGASKVVDASGAPMPVYHGTADDFDAFDPNRSGSATAHMTATLGTFFAEDQAKAQRYAENASQGVPADERVVDAYLSIQKPYVMGLKEFMAVDSQEEATALREKLKAEGFDGIQLKEFGQWVAFEPTQIKSASENRGTFDAGNPNIYFSRSADSVDALDKGQQVQQDTLVQRAKDWAAGKFEDLLPASLSLLQRRHLTELMAGQAPLRAAKQYDETVQALDADRAQLLAGAPDAAEHPENMLKAGAAPVAEELRAFTHEKGVAGWFGRKSEQGKQLATVMHEATIQGVDPSKGYQRLQMKGPRGEWVDWSPKLVKERIAVLKEVMMGRSGDDKAPMMDEIKSLRSLKYREKKRQEAYPALVAKYQALPEQGKALYQKMRDWYEQMSDATADALEARIMALRGDMEASEGKEIAERHTRMLVQKLRAEFEENKVTGVYFPLTRNGDYWVSYKDKAGDQGFQRFETSNDEKRFLKELAQKGGTTLATGRLDGNLKAADAPSGTFIAEVIGSLKKAGASEKAQDEVYQTFLRTLPEVSMRKHAIHRKATPGYSEDITRAFAQNAYHGAHQLARLRWAHRLQSLVDGMQKNMDAARKMAGADPQKIGRADALLGELKKRHDAIMSPNDTQVANTLNGIGFLYYMGASPASAIVNLTQNAQVTLPVLGAHHGWGKATRMLGAAMRDSMKTGGNIDRTLRDEELRAYNALRARGDIDKTQAHTMAGLAEGSLLQANPVYAKVMNGLTWMFHKAEVVNREAAGIAAYRLARLRGDDFNRAVQYASEIINGTHFDYSAANRPRIMQGNTARVALQFKNYSASMTWMLYRNLHQAFKGETAEVRRVARKTLTGILGMTSVFAGVMGLPIINVVRAVAGAAHAAAGDDDEPWDFNIEFRAWLAEHLGADVANWVADGAVSQVTGANIASRVGMADLWFRDADRALEGKDAFYNYLEGVAGPMAGLAKNIFIGTDMIGEGHTWRGFETMLPKFAKDAMKATRYAHEGVNSLRGDPIMEDVSPYQDLMQGLGFQPTALREQQRINSALMNYTQAVRDRRTSLLNAYAMAFKDGDTDAARDVLAKMAKFSSRWPEIAIRPGTIRDSLRQRAKLSAQSQHGIMLDKRIGGRIQQELGVMAGQ